ncbi:Predicted dehydrogenase [Xaviernesmea oryzae]|uniref:Predicted dehydrogenase n=2 Tax=Xaviernesmea oryzae TaxID=464029 RepID=A0A1X7DX13_9HYPH|nr:Predicted dehydrogenase [Xaviernesmea oryzae]
MQSDMILRVGVVGSGNISAAYMRNSALFSGAVITACSDLVQENARRRAEEFGLRAMSVDALLSDPEIDLVLNLTVPAAHFDVSLSALSAGKHVFTEKPLATTFGDGKRLVEEAEKRNLLIGSAPDTFLGAAGRRARALIDEGMIGRPVAGTAFMLGRGMEHWHQAPQFYYQRGAGPMFDMGPYYLTMLVNLLGPIARVQAVATKGQEERLISAEGPFKNTRFPVETPTTLLTLLEFRSGAVVTFGASWDVFRHSNHPIELHGTAGSLRLPDPDTFGGTVSLSRMGEDWIDFPSDSEPFGAINFPFATPRKANYRFLGIAELADALREGRQPRASGRLALHVLDAMEGILTSSEQRASVGIESMVERPEFLVTEYAAALCRP